LRAPDDEPIIFDVADDAEPAKPAKVFETLRPLAIWEDPTKKSLFPAEPPQRGSRTRLAMVFGGACALLALGIGSGIYLESFWPNVAPAENPSHNLAYSADANVEDEPAEPQSSTDNTNDSDLVPDEDTPSVFNVPTPARTTVRRRSARPRVSLVRHRPRFSLATDRRPPRLIHPQFWVSDFKPTTLVIYVENGQVKTRVEPWTRSDNK